MLSVEAVEPGAPIADDIVRSYMCDVASRYYGRPATPAEVDQAILDEPYGDLTGDAGTFLVARWDGHPVACAGIRFVDEIGEVTKVFTRPSFRGQGIAAQLVQRLEEMCDDRNVRCLRLDTRAELAEACALYEKLGFVRVPAFNDEPYSDRWYEKAVSGNRT